MEFEMTVSIVDCESKAISIVIYSLISESFSLEITSKLFKR